MATVAVLALIGGGAAVPAAAELPPDPGGWVTQPVDPGRERTAAQAQAAETGVRVEVVGERSETGQVFANPDGSFTSETNMAPVRVRRDNGWVPVDTTLEARPDGTVAPKAVPLGVSFSGGGTTPMVRLGKDAKELALSWPGALPTPRLEGDAAIYPDVFAGVDLRLRATVQGLSQVLVVKTRQAAANPALASVHFGLSTTGLSVTADAAGNLGAVDEAGTLVFGAAAPLMWDSTPAPDAATGGMPGPDRPGARQAVSAIAVGTGRLELRPDQKLLADPATTFPVYIDPYFTEGAAGWTLVQEGVATPKWNGANDTTPIVGKSGYSDWDGPAVKYRTYFQFNTGQVLGTVLKSAQFRVMEIWAPSCSPRPVSAYGTAPIHHGTNWANQPSQQWAVGMGSHDAAAGYPGCAARFLEWNASAAVAESVRRGLSTTTIMLRANSEGDRYAWKKWLVNADSPKLTVTYNRLPARPYDLSVEHKGCGTPTNQPYVNPLNPSGQAHGPTLRARVSDPDGGLVRAGFEWSLADGTRVGGAEAKAAGSTSLFAAQIPGSTFKDGETFRYRVVGRDPTDSGPWTGYCYATIDRTRPAAPATVSSATYPRDDIGGAAGFTAGFTFRAPPSSDVAGFMYGLHDQPTRFVAASGTPATASVLVTPPDNGPHTLYVYSVDRANNVSSTRFEYGFTVGRGTAPVAHWRLDGLTDTRVPDSRPQRHDGTINFGPARWQPGRLGDALFLDGSTSSHVNTGNGPAVRTDTSFSVAAWVKLAETGTANQVVVSQDGTQPSAFTLQYAGDVKKWAFTMAQSDTTPNTASDRVLSTAPARSGVWTHLVGTYEPSSGDLRLYVDGVLQTGVGKHTNRWTHATGTVQLGRGKYNGGYTGYLRGGLDEVRIHNRVITAREVQELASAPVEEVFLPLDEGAGTTTVDESGNLRSAQLGPEAGWTPGADVFGGGTAVRFGGTAGAVATTGKTAVRTDQSFMVSAQVRLDPAAAAGTGTLTAVSQDGPLSSGFTLGYDRGTRGWRFAVSHADAASPTTTWVDSSATGTAATPGTWTHLLGVYDAATGKVTLFVDGQPTDTKNGRSTADVSGGLVLGRDLRNRQAAGHWVGAVDDVHAWTGVNEAEGLSTYRFPVAKRRSAYDGQFNRFLTINAGNADHATLPGGAARYYHFEGGLGSFAPADAPNTRMLYACRAGGDDVFTSPEPTCEGQEVLGPLGPVYRDPPPDRPVLAIYRCLVVKQGIYSDHFDSTDPECEGQKVEFRLGYTQPYVHLVRYFSPTFPHDHTSSTTRVAADYLPEGALGRLAIHGGDGRTVLRNCRDGDDAFVSTDAACEGKTVVQPLGWIWTAPPENFASRELLRCRTEAGELFESTNAACEGQAFVKSIGYVVVGV